MKKQLLSFIFFVITGLSIGQTVVDTVSVGAGYTHQVWYQLENGTKTSVAKNTWDIGFQAEPFTVSVFINSYNNTKLWVYPGDTTDWASLDTMGYTSWTQQYNDTSDWSKGAFAQPQVGLHYGWGGYNTTTHQVIGDKLFLLQLHDGSFQKVWIQSLISGVYTFRHASLDNNMDMVHTIDKSSYPNKANAYFNLLTHSASDPEPSKADWDLLFTKFNDYVPTPYMVSAALLNPGLRAAKVSPVDTAVSDTNAVAWSNYRDAIGGDWKAYQGAWVVHDSITYYIEDNMGAIWKLIFTGFGGMSNGNFIFTKEKLTSLSVAETQQEIPFLNLYPNPTTDVLNIVVKANENLNYKIFNVQGTLVMGGKLNNSKGSLSTKTMNLGNFNKGVYFIQFHTGTTASTHKIIVK